MSDQGEYFSHVRKQDTDYLIAYEAWENTLTPRERALLGSAAAPQLEDFKAHSSKKVTIGTVGDASDRSAASFEPDLAGALDGDPENLAEMAGVSLGSAKAICRFMAIRIEREAARREAAAIVAIAGAFLKGTNSKLLAAGLAYASDLSVTNGLGTMQDWAMQNGVSRAAVSKVAKFWQRELGLPAGSHMRDEQKCRAYSEAQKRKHWRNQKISAALEAEQAEKI